MYNNSLYVQYPICQIFVTAPNLINPSMDPFSSLFPDGTRYTDLICTIVFVRARRFSWGTSWHTLLHHLDFKPSSSDRILYQTQIPENNYLKTVGSSRVPIFILLLCTAVIGRKTENLFIFHTDEFNEWLKENVLLVR
jgi:hypothetical protein